MVSELEPDVISETEMARIVRRSPHSRFTNAIHCLRDQIEKIYGT